MDRLIDALVVGEERVGAVELVTVGYPRANIVRIVSIHVAIECEAGRVGEATHVYESPREAAVGGFVVEVVGINDVGRLRVIDSSASTPARLDIHLRERVVAVELRVFFFQEFIALVLNHRIPFGHIFLVPVVFAGENRIEQVALHVEIGIAVFVETVLVLASFHRFLYRILLLVGLHKEDGVAVIRRQLKEESATVFRLLHGAHDLSVGREFRLDKHLVFQRSVVHTKVRSIGGARKIGFLTHRRGLCFGIARGSTFRVVGGFSFRKRAARHQSRVFGVRATLLRHHRLDVVQSLDLFTLHALNIEHRIDRTLDGESLFGLVAQCVHGSVASPSLHQHEQVEAAPMLCVVALEIVGRIGHEALQIGGQKHFGEYVAVAIGGVVGAGIAHGERESGAGWQGIFFQTHLQRYPFVGLEIGFSTRGNGHGNCRVVLIDKKHSRGQNVAVFIENKEFVDAGGEGVRC